MQIALKKKRTLKGISRIVAHDHYYQRGYHLFLSPTKSLFIKNGIFYALLILVSQSCTCAVHKDSIICWGKKKNYIKPINVCLLFTMSKNTAKIPKFLSE